MPKFDKMGNTIYNCLTTDIFTNIQIIFSRLLDSIKMTSSIGNQRHQPASFAISDILELDRQNNPHHTELDPGMTEALYTTTDLSYMPRHWPQIDHCKFKNGKTRKKRDETSTEKGDNEKLRFRGGVEGFGRKTMSPKGQRDKRRDTGTPAAPMIVF